MALAPIIPRAERKRRNLREDLLNTLCDSPSLTNIEIAAAVGCHPATVKAMRNSDAFAHDLSERIKDKYGQSLQQVRQSILDTHIIALKRLGRDLNDDSLSPSERQGAAKLALEHAEKIGPFQGERAPSEQAPGVAVTINMNDLQRARTRAIEHADSIELEAHDVTKDLSAGEHSYLSARREEGDEV